MKAAKDKEQTSEDSSKESCKGDGHTWTEAADKAQDELDEASEVKKDQSDEMKQHAGG